VARLSALLGSRSVGLAAFLSVGRVVGLAAFLRGSSLRLSALLGSRAGGLAALSGFLVGLASLALRRLMILMPFIVGM
jgi:hypothetical protein